MNRGWFLTWTTYGTWLIGDERGFVGNVADSDGTSVRHNTPGQDYDKDIPALRFYMLNQLKCPPIWLNREQADTAIAQFLETASFRGWTLLAAAVMPNHVHLVVGVPYDPDPSKLLQDFKSYGSRLLSAKWGKPASDTWWTEGGSKRKRVDNGSIAATIRYVRDQSKPLSVFLGGDAIRTHLPEFAHDLLASGGRQPPVDNPTALETNRGLTSPARQATIIEAPQEYYGSGPSVFLAGGISGTLDWQTVVVEALSDLPITILNPRRKNYPWHEPSAAAAQIEWEFRHLRGATAVLFWFPPETLCPIALFELGGRVLVREQALFVGTDPGYARKLDVEIQLRLARPEVRLVASCTELGGQVRDWFASPQST